MFSIVTYDFSKDVVSIAISNAGQIPYPSPILWHPSFMWFAPISDCINRGPTWQASHMVSTYVVSSYHSGHCALQINLSDRARRRVFRACEVIIPPRRSVPCHGVLTPNTVKPGPNRVSPTRRSPSPRLLHSASFISRLSFVRLIIWLIALLK